MIMKNLAHIISTITLGAILSVAPVITGLMTTDATVFDASNQPVLFQNIPACNAARDMSKMAITDGPAGPVMGQIVTGGGGSAHDILMCNGTATTPNWIVVAGGIGTGGAPPPPSTTMAAPSSTSNTATISGTYTLAAEDQFTDASLNTTNWEPATYNGVCGGGCLGTYHRWNGDNGSGQLALPYPFSAQANCPGSISATSPAWDGTINNTAGCSANNFIDNYYNPFPYGTSVNAGDGNHLLGGASNGNQLSLVMSPGRSNVTQPAGTDPVSNQFSNATVAYDYGMVWTSSVISSTHNGPFMMPATGGYLQIRIKQADSTKGAWPGIVLYQDALGTNNPANEIDVMEGGFFCFNYSCPNGQGNGSAIVSSSFHPTAVGSVSNMSCPQQYPATTTNRINLTNVGNGNTECQVDVGVDLSQAYHIFGVEYIPQGSPYNGGVAKITTFFDGHIISQFSGNGIGTTSYDLFLGMDMGAGVTWRTVQDWPTTITPSLPAPAETYTMQINDVQRYKLPGQ